MNTYAFGVDIGGTSVKMGIFNQEGCLLKKWEIPTVTEDNGSQILAHVAASIKKEIGKEKIPLEAILGIGVGAPGPVDEMGTVHKAVNLGWEEFNIPEKLQEYIKLPVKAANDANIAAFGEMWQGGGKGYDDLVAVTLGTGVGGGIIINGNILTGATGAGGEIGHMHIEDDEEEICGCKNKGCFEQYASATGIVRLANRRLAQDNKESILRGQELSAKAVFDAIKEKDPVAIEIATTYGKYLGKGLAMIGAVVNPEIFVIGGGMSKAGEIIFEYMKPAYEKYAFVACHDAKFALAKLGNDAGIYGAAGLFLMNDKRKK